jgi:8-amino-7-oxononanoate synthase
VSRHPELETIRYCIRSYIFTASSSPMMVACTRKALQILQSEPALRRQLHDNFNRLYKGLQSLGLPIGPSPSPVVAVALEDRAQAIKCWNALMEAGVYVNLVVPPASPSTNFLLRNSVSAAHSSAQIDTMIATYAGLVDAGLIDAKQNI